MTSVSALLDLERQYLNWPLRFPSQRAGGQPRARFGRFGTPLPMLSLDNTTPKRKCEVRRPGAATTPRTNTGVDGGT